MRREWANGPSPLTYVFGLRIVHLVRQQSNRKDSFKRHSARLGVTSAVEEITTPDCLTLGRGNTVLIPAGSVMRSEYVAPFSGVNETRPRPSCSVRKTPTSLPALSTIRPATSAG